jgi:protein O-mannosyl-transferase
VKAQTTQTSNLLVRIAGGATIILLAVMAYQPALDGKFVWDDDSWTTGISWLLRSPEGLWKMWSNVRALQQYYPLTGTTFWIDYHLWGFWTYPYHVENLVLHILSALLFWQLLRRLQVPGAWLAATIFALHPLMVESVAWITERKNVLSMVLYLSALLAYGRFTGFWSTNDPPKRDWKFYGLAFALFVLALLAKTTAFSFPAVVLLIRWWKKGKIDPKRDLLPTLPLLAVSIGFCSLTGWLEKHHVGAHGPEWQIPFAQRCLIAGRVFWFYIGKLIWPSNLCFVYSRWRVDPHSLAQWLIPASAVGVLIGLWLARSRIGRGPAAAAFFYVGTLFPSLGFMNAYFMRYSFVCDHWAYLSTLGLIALAGAMIARIRVTGSMYAFAAVLLPIYAVLTWQQCGIYKDIETLWRDTLAKDSSTWLALNNLGIVLRNEGKIPEAIELYRESLRYDPDFPETHNNLGVALKQEGKLDEAIAEYNIALRLKPDYADARNDLGNALRAQGNLPQAIEQYDLAIQDEPEFAEAYFNLAIAYAQEGKSDQAIAAYQQAIGIDPDYFEARCNLGLLLAESNHLPEAIEQYAEAVRIRPHFAMVRNDYAIILSQAGQTRDAIAQWQIALQLKRNQYPGAAINLASQLATMDPSQGGDPAQAVTWAQMACEQTQYQIPGYLDTLAMAYAAAGRLDDAVATDNKAMELAQAAGQSQLVAQIQSRLNSYHHDPTTAPNP